MERSRRLFVAVDLPAAVRRHLSSIARGIGGRATPEDQIHVTVRFLGSVAEPVFEEIRREIATISIPGFECRAEGVGRFPPRDAPRVLWAGLSPAEPFLLLEGEISSALDRIGIAREERPFSPHATLARIRNARPGGANRFLEKNAAYSSETFPVREFLLYSSEITPEGARHTVEKKYSLSRRACYDE
jgi:RNA 2',3'-cyclic 3'-phosphodiesterase